MKWKKCSNTSKMSLASSQKGMEKILMKWFIRKIKNLSTKVERLLKINMAATYSPVLWCSTIVSPEARLTSLFGMRRGEHN